MNFKLKNYYKPTPVLMRKIGDTLLWSYLSIAGCAIIGDIKWLAIVGLASGIIGKFLTNLFAENTTDIKNNIQADLPPVQPNPNDPRPR